MAARSFAAQARQLLISGFDPFAPDASVKLEAADVWPTLVRESTFGSSPREVLEVMRILAIDGDTVRAADAPHLVATLPVNVHMQVRRTAPVVREIIEGARREILAVGYAVTSSEFLGWLAEASRRRVDVLLVVDRRQVDLRHLLSSWPMGLTLPACFTDAESGGQEASMHSKLIVADSARMLVTSANFSHRGHRANIEVGVDLPATTAVAARELFRRLIVAGVLTRVDLSQVRGRALDPTSRGDWRVS